MDTHLFLFGGGPPFMSGLAKHFASLVGDKGRRCSVLFIGRQGGRISIKLYERT